MAKSRLPRILADIAIERGRQIALYGVQNNIPLEWLPILAEEVGEVSAAIQKNDILNYRTEMIQVAAVAVAAIETLDRQIDAAGRDLGD